MSDELLDPHDALIYIMVLVSAVDADMTDQELQRMGSLVRHLPVFSDYQEEGMVTAAERCAAILGRDGGLDQVFDLIVASLPAALSETAYAIACDMAAVDLHVGQEELRLLEMLRHRLDIDRLVAAAIERGAKARHATL